MSEDESSSEDEDLTPQWGTIEYKFKGFCSSTESMKRGCPYRLGDDLVRQIPPGHSDAFRDWLDEKRAGFERVESLYEADYFTITLDEIKNSHKLVMKPYRPPGIIAQRVWPRKSDGTLCDWLYTINLDRNIFSVNQNQHFDLANIPENWKQYVPGSGHGTYIDNGDSTEAKIESTNYTRRVERHLAVDSVHPGPGSLSLRVSQPVMPDMAGEGLVEALNTVMMLPQGLHDCSPGRKSAIRFAKKLCGEWLNAHSDDIDFFVPQLTSEDTLEKRLVRGSIYFVVMFAAGFPDHVTFGELFHGFGIYHINTKNPFDDRCEWVPESCYGLRVEGFSRWLCPEEPIFWFCDVVIYPLLVSTESELSERHAVSRVVRFGKNSGKSSFQGAIISPKKCILVRVFPDRTEIGNSLQLLSNHDDQDGFVALSCMLEDEIRRKLNQSKSRCGLPAELMCQIVNHADYDTWKQLRNTSRELREYCDQRRWPINSDIALMQSENDRPTLVGMNAHQNYKLYFGEDDTKVKLTINAYNSRVMSRHQLWVPIVGTSFGRRMAVRESAFAVEEVEEGTVGEPSWPKRLLRAVRRDGRFTTTTEDLRR